MSEIVLIAGTCFEEAKKTADRFRELGAQRGRPDDRGTHCARPYRSGLKVENEKLKIGEFIELCDERNSEGIYTLKNLRGVSIEKKFIDTKADMADVSLAPYIVVKPKYFVFVPVTSRNGEKITLKKEANKRTTTIKNLDLSLPIRDSSGNEYAQEQTETGEYITSVLQDYTGILNDPYSFKFTKGLHKITLVGPEQALLIKEITLTIPEDAEDYSVVSKNYNLKANNSDIITIQAENADIKNSKSLIPKSNNSDASMTPNDPYKSKINFIKN